MSTISEQVTKQARHRCGYCLTLEIVSGVPLILEQIIPKIKGGLEVEENLWLACHLCSEAKGTLTEAVDPQTGLSAPLFNPRTQFWISHFAWSHDGQYIIGLTASGRATVEALSLNSEWRRRLRAIWAQC